MAEVNVRVSDSGRLFPDAVVIKVDEQEIIAGQDGISPVVTVTEIGTAEAVSSHGYEVDVSDAAGVHTYSVYDGASAYAQAVAGGYSGTEEEFAADLIGFNTRAAEATAGATAAAAYADAASDSATAAAASESNADVSATAAASSASEAASSAGAATTAAGSASSSATAAAESATSASNKASEAASSESNAASSATAAAASATAAAASETAAASSASSAANSATSAAASAAAIEEYEHDAEAWAIGKRGGVDVDSSDDTYHNNSKYYAEQAAASSTTASSAAAAASQSAQDAAASATAASQSKDNAASSATAAAGSATAAAGSASTATTAASTAEGHATNAASSATAASGSATSAASSATAAGNAQTAAEDAQEAAETAQAAAESARDTAITTLQTEGAAQRTAIQQKGAETLASIPEDYTELSDDVDDLKSALNDVSEGTVDYLQTMEWLTYTSPSRKISKKCVPGTIFTLTNTNTYYIGAVETPSTTPSAWARTVETSEEKPYIAFRRNDSADISAMTSSEVNACFSVISYTTKTQKQLDELADIVTGISGDIDTLETTVDTLETTVADYVVPYESTNVFDPTAITPGKLCNGYGNLEDNTSAITTDFYAVSPGDKVRFIPYTLNNNQSIYVFKADGTVISSGFYPRTDYNDYSEITIPSGNNAGAKFRLNIYFRDFTGTVITINQPFSRSLAGQKGKYFALNQYDYESRLFGKFITYNGDSICEGRYNGTASNGGAYANIISRLTGSRAENRAISGGILASAVPSGITPQRLIVNDIVNMSADADIVCIEGGYNDYARNVPLGDITPESEITEETTVTALDTTTICGALESIFRQAKLKWLGKPIVFVIVHKVQKSYYTNNTALTPYTFKDVHDKIVQICNKYAIPYYDACLYSGLNGHDVNQSNTYLTSNNTGTGDGTHPNEAGYRRYYVPQLIKLFESVMPILESE